MRRFLGVIFACAVLCGLAVVICATPPPPNPDAIEITINCNPETGGVKIPFFVISHSKKATTTIQWTNACGKGNALVLFKGDTPLIDGNGNEEHAVQIRPGQSSYAYGVSRVPAPPPGTAPDEIYKVYKYDLTVFGDRTWDPGGGVRP